MFVKDILYFSNMPLIVILYVASEYSFVGKNATYPTTEA